MRPRGITALGLFFAFGTTMSFLSGVMLLFPGSFLEPLWQLNPRAKDHFILLGGLAPLLMGVVSMCCAIAAVGLFRGRRLGYRFALGLLAVNLAGDLLTAVLGVEPRAVLGVPIAALLLFYLLANARVRAFFFASPVV